jgi:hypothetical protein
MNVELRRAPGICCPEPSCDYKKIYKSCQMCGKDCMPCKFYKGGIRGVE